MILISKNNIKNKKKNIITPIQFLLFVYFFFHFHYSAFIHLSQVLIKLDKYRGQKN